MHFVAFIDVIDVLPSFDMSSENSDSIITIITNVRKSNQLVIARRFPSVTTFGNKADKAGRDL